MIRTGLKLGALGAPHTFNAQAAKLLLERYPEFADIAYYPTSDAVIEAALSGDVDAACAPEQMSKTGVHKGMLARMTAPDSTLYVIAEAARGYDCSLLGKPGAKLSQVRRVLGHNGSIAHSRAWLEANLPGASVEVLETHSAVAAAAVLESDGSIASVGGAGLAAEFGLATLAGSIDDGSAVNYWAVSLQQLFSQSPTRLLVSGRFGDDDQLSDLVRTMADLGYRLRTAYSQHTGRVLSEQDCMLRFAGTGKLETVRAALVGFGSARLAGAWDARG
jgi:chorismate mutase/prephenate dehydratase